jgi:hypothetical protein
MFLLRSPLKQLIAVTLPISFGWMFISCVALCTEHSVDIQTHSAALLSNSISATHDEECCPIKAAAPSALPERRVDTMPLRNYQQAALMLSTQFAEPAVFLCKHTRIPGSTTDPPFERLCTMRI